MTDREIYIAGNLLKALHDTNGAQLGDVVLHSRTSFKCSTPQPSRTEYEQVRDLCDARGWITGVQSQNTGRMVWMISDKGLAVMNDLR